VAATRLATCFRKENTMTISYDLENQSAESAVAVNMKPLDSEWTLVSTTNRPDGYREALYRKDGETITRPPGLLIHYKPIVRISHINDRKNVVDGFEYLVRYSTHIKCTDSVAGELDPMLVNFRFAFQVQGSALPEKAEVLQMALTIISSMWSSVTANVPDESGMTKVSIGNVELI
jgi:hypothetical protein